MIMLGSVYVVLEAKKKQNFEKKMTRLEDPEDAKKPSFLQRKNSGGSTGSDSSPRNQTGAGSGLSNWKDMSNKIKNPDKDFIPEDNGEAETRHKVFTEEQLQDVLPGCQILKVLE